MAGRPGVSAAAPTEPYAWTDAPLSTRSLSYVSTISALGSQAQPASTARPYDNSRNASIISQSSTWRPDLEDMEEDDLQMEEQELLPHSVAQSPLFKLPRELREKIYQYCLTLEEKPVVEWPAQPGSVLGIAPQLLLTCRLIHEEATAKLYLQNTFGFDHPSNVNIFIRCMVSQPHAPFITKLNLHFRTQDTRLWMNYLTSSDSRRSLKHDFPGLEELTIQYRSVRWSSQASIEANMRNWAEDRHLDELVVGLRHLYFDPYKGVSTSGLSDEQVATLRNYEDEDYEMQDVTRDLKVREKLREIRRKLEDQFRDRKSPRIRVVCMCRVPLSHFQALTGQATHLVTTPPQVGQDQAQAVHQQMFQQDPATRQTSTPVAPAKEGDEYTGFTQIDFTGRAKRLSSKDFPGGAAAWAAKTVFLNRKNILLALQVFTFENAHDIMR